MEKNNFPEKYEFGDYVKVKGLSMPFKIKGFRFNENHVWVYCEGNLNISITDIERKCTQQEIDSNSLNSQSKYKADDLVMMKDHFIGLQVISHIDENTNQVQFYVKEWDYKISGNFYLKDIERIATKEEISTFPDYRLGPWGNLELNKVMPYYQKFDLVKTYPHAKQTLATLLPFSKIVSVHQSKGGKTFYRFQLSEELYEDSDIERKATDQEEKDNAWKISIIQIAQNLLGNYLKKK